MPGPADVTGWELELENVQLACHRTHSLGVKQTYRQLHSTNILQLHADPHRYEHKRSAFLNNLHSVLLAYININCFEWLMQRLLGVFPQRRKCYFYTQCMPLSSDAFGLIRAVLLSTSSLASKTHTHIQKTHDENAGKSTKCVFSFQCLYCISVFAFCSRVETHTKSVGCHFLSSIMSNPLVPVCEPR